MRPKSVFNVFVYICLVLFLFNYGCESGDSHHDSHDGDDHEGHGHNEEEGGHDEQAIELTQELISKYGIEIGTAGPAPLDITLQLPGKIVINSDKLVHITPRVPGVVREVRKKLGEPVQEGEVVAIIESRDLADAKASYLASLEKTSLAQANYKREEGLWKKKRISSEQEFLDAKQTFAEMRIELQTAKHKLQALGFSQEYLKKLPKLKGESLTRFEITAPFDGTVIQKHITLGEVLGEGANIFTVADLRTVWVELQVYAKDLAMVRTGQSVIIRADNGSTQTKGKIFYLSALINEGSRTARARVVIKNQNGLWKPGLFVTGQVAVDTIPVTIRIPKEAVQTLENKPHVFVQDEDGFEPVPVTLGRTDSMFVEVVDGMKKGQRFVSKNAFVLKAEIGKAGAKHEH